MPRKKTFLANVAVMAALRHTLTYRVPAGAEVRPGQRVLVPLGARRATGIVLETVARVAPGMKVRDILRVVDPEPLLSPELLVLGTWIADYYFAPIGEVFSAMLPLRAETRRARLLELTERGREELEGFNRSLLEEARSGEEATLLRYLADHPGAALESVRRKFAASPQLLPHAFEKGWITLSRVERERGRRTIFAAHLAAPATQPMALPVAPLMANPPLPERPARLSPVARRLLEALERRGAVEDHRELLKSARASVAHLKKLSQQGLVELNESKTKRANVEAHGHVPLPTQGGATPGPAPLPATPAQASVLGELTAHLESRAFRAALLQGVTASGKTEVYLRLIAHCLERGRAALMLVPEIALTPAVESLFLERFGSRVAVLHSGLSETERHDAWWRVRRSEARVVLGTRSAIFAPLEKLGVVIVDEEHESSYKQEETPRYHGRDVAVLRARLAKALVILGSATPSLESAWNARQGRYHRSLLEERIGGRPLATVEIIDMREEFRVTHSQVPISRRLKDEIQAQLASKSQTMILLNRRGYSWFMLCRSCGESVRCRNCSISLTYHRREHRLICHYCGYSAAIPSRCPACGSEFLYSVGEGTEKMEQKLAELFPAARVERVDRDVARRPGHFYKVLSDFRQGKIDILVGTQLIAKGHDFPGVTLVGVVSADTGLALPDFRAAERTFQLLTQAAGRAGRGEAPGRVLVQTFYPEHYAIRLAAEQNYEGFFVQEMSFRRVMRYPPITALANVLAVDTSLERAAKVAKQIGDFLAAVEDRDSSLKVLGPAPAPLARIEGRYRIQFLIRATSRARLNAVLRALVVDCDRRGISPRSMMIDVDPVNLM